MSKRKPLLIIRPLKPEQRAEIERRFWEKFAALYPGHPWLAMREAKK